jgi:hypothetical protein
MVNKCTALHVSVFNNIRLSKNIKSNFAWAHILLRMLMGRTFHMLFPCKMAGVTFRADAAQLDMAATG